MAWVKLDDQFFSHPKVLPLSKGAKLLYLSGLAYASAQLTDGRLNPSAVVLAARTVSVSPKLADELVAAGLWDSTEGIYAIHDYLTYNPDRASVLAHRAEVSGLRAAAGRIGGVRSGESRREKIEAKPKQNASPFAYEATKQNRSPVPYPSPTPTTSVDQLEETNTNPNTNNGAAPPAAAVLALPASRAAQRPTYGADFEAWWSAYPRHEAKKPALDAYNVRRRAGRSASALLAAAKNLAGYVDEHGTPTEKIPHATTFLNQHRDEGWENGPPDQRRSNVNGLRIAPRDEPRGFQGIREAFADLMPAQEGA